MSLYPVLYSKFAGLQQHQSQEQQQLQQLQANNTEGPRLVYPVGSPAFVRIEKRLSDCAVGIPAVIEENNDTIRFSNTILTNDEFGRYAAGRMIMACTCLLGAKVYFMWRLQKLLSGWMETKDDPLRAHYITNVIADAIARQKIARTEGSEFYEDIIASADMICVSMLARKSETLSTFFQSALCAAVLGHPAAYVPSPISRVTEDFARELKTITRGAPCNEAILDDLYDIASVIPGPWHRIYLPYANHLVKADRETSIFSNSPDRKIFESIRSDKRLVPVDYEGDRLCQDLFYEISSETRRRKKILSRLARGAAKADMSSFGFPPSDIASYKQLYEEMMPRIKRMVEQARMVRNVLDESMFEQTGNIDLQVAIQAMASETYRTDTFVKDEDLLKNESWAILVDSSLSLGGVVRHLKATSLCIAEIAKEIIGANPWGMFAFSDELYCIKDFSEPYDNLAKSRIGGLAPGGLSHIPDAIRTCRNMLLEHARERNYIILLSDGLPSGYPGIETELARAIKEASVSGVAIAAIGLGSAKIKKFIPNTKIVNEPTELARAFAEIYFSLSS